MKTKKTRKDIKFILFTFLGLIVFAVFYTCLGAAFEGNEHLQLRPWTTKVFLIITILFGVAIAVGILFALFKNFKIRRDSTEKQSLQSVLSALGIIIVLISTPIMVFLGVFVTSFFDKYEYVVEQDGKKMVKIVETFFEVDVYVYYYEYKNFLLCGREPIEYPFEYSSISTALQS